VADPVNPGNRVAEFVLRGDSPVVHDVRRVEVKLGCVGLGEAYRYAFAAFLPAEYPVEASFDNIAQWHDMPDFLLGESWRSPSLKLMVRNGRWIFSHRWSAAKVNRFLWEREGRGQREECDLGAVENGKWVRWEFDILWAWNEQGRLRITRDGREVLRQQGPTAYRDWRGPYFKIGMYKPQWTQKTANSSVQERRICYDNIKVSRLDIASLAW
jgi:hypothetical protein